jgi:hypothetical protein
VASDAPVLGRRVTHARDDARRIAAVIRGAFAWRERPGDGVPLAVGAGIDSESVERDLRGKRWHELTFEVLSYNRAGLSFMTPAAYLYYLPAFAIAALSDEPGSADIRYTLLFGLTPAPGESYDADVRARLQWFTPEEKRALEELFRYDIARSTPDPLDEVAMRRHEAELRRIQLFWNLDG